MSRCMMAAVLAVALTAASGYGEAYSTGFEFDNQDALVAGLAAEGWTWGQNGPNLNTDPAYVHSGTRSLRLWPRVLIERPLGYEFGTLEMWVYDNGAVYDDPPTGPNLNGQRWGMSKNGECVAAHLWSRSFLPCSAGYAANPGQSASPKEGDQWFSSTFVAAGDPAAHARVAAGWMKWQFAYYPDGTIEINLLEDPNGGGAKAFNSNTVGEPVAPGWTWGESIEFADETTGGVEAIYLMGSWAADEPFGPLYVDDLTWTPYDGPAFHDGDANGDDAVNLEDFVVLKNNFGTQSGATWGQGDFNGDGAVNLEDFVILKNNFGWTAP